MNKLYKRRNYLIHLIEGYNTDDVNLHKNNEKFIDMLKNELSVVNSEIEGYVNE